MAKEKKVTIIIPARFSQVQIGSDITDKLNAIRRNDGEVVLLRDADVCLKDYRIARIRVDIEDEQYYYAQFLRPPVPPKRRGKINEERLRYNNLEGLMEQSSVFVSGYGFQHTFRIPKFFPQTIPL